MVGLVGLLGCEFVEELGPASSSPTNADASTSDASTSDASTSDASTAPERPDRDVLDAPAGEPAFASQFSTDALVGIGERTFNWIEIVLTTAPSACGLVARNTSCVGPWSAVERSELQLRVLLPGTTSVGDVELGELPLACESRSAGVAAATWVTVRGEQLETLRAVSGTISLTAGLPASKRGRYRLVLEDGRTLEGLIAAPHCFALGSRVSACDECAFIPCANGAAIQHFDPLDGECFPRAP